MNVATVAGLFARTTQYSIKICMTLLTTLPLINTTAAEIRKRTTQYYDKMCKTLLTTLLLMVTTAAGIRERTTIHSRANAVGDPTPRVQRCVGHVGSRGQCGGHDVCARSGPRHGEVSSLARCCSRSYTGNLHECI